MLNALLKLTAPLVLFSALVFLTGAAAAAASLAGNAKTDLCCQKEAEREMPAADAECSDAECRCLSCNVPLLFRSSDLLSPNVPEYRPLSTWARFIPAAPDRSIDYPPEFS